jgi:hypothetical protein
VPGGTAGHRWAWVDTTASPRDRRAPHLLDRYRRVEERRGGRRSPGSSAGHGRRRDPHDTNPVRVAWHGVPCGMIKRSLALPNLDHRATSQIPPKGQGDRRCNATATFCTFSWGGSPPGPGGRHHSRREEPRPAVSARANTRHDTATTTSRPRGKMRGFGGARQSVSCVDLRRGSGQA